MSHLHPRAEPCRPPRELRRRVLLVGLCFGALLLSVAIGWAWLLERSERVLIDAIRDDELTYALVERLADPDDPVSPQQGSGFRGTTLLMIAAGYGSDDSARVLLSAGADVTRRDMSGNTPLMYACGADKRWRHRVSDSEAEMVTLLVEAGANVNAISAYGDSVLIIAVRRCDWDAIDTLIALGAVTDATDGRGNSLAYNAATLGGVDVIWGLASRGIRFDEIDEEGNTLLHIATMEGYPSPEKFEALIEVGVDPTVRNNLGQSAYDLAASNPYFSADYLRPLRVDGE